MARCPSEAWDRHIRDLDAVAEAEESGEPEPPPIICAKHGKPESPGFGCVECY